jgi:hypothetical protein
MLDIIEEMFEMSTNNIQLYPMKVVCFADGSEFPTHQGPGEKV